MNITSDGSKLAYIALTSTNVPIGYGDKIGTIATQIGSDGIACQSEKFRGDFNALGIYMAEGYENEGYFIRIRMEHMRLYYLLTYYLCRATSPSQEQSMV